MMTKTSLEGNISNTVANQAVKSSKQAIVVSQDQNLDYSFNAILDTSGSISLGAGDTPPRAENNLTLGSIRAGDINNEDFLALLLDPEDINALIESNLEMDLDSSDSVLFSGPKNSSILKIEDVLYKDDGLDEYLPPAKNEKWYLLGNGTAIDKAITGPGMQDIHDALLMQQLMQENYVEK
jgi:hypothetical protein